MTALYIYKDNSFEQHHQEKLKELWETFKDDNPKWILKHECLNLKSVDNCIFVFSIFEGPAFEHLKNLQARIISAHCILNSIKKQKKLPRSSTPVYSFSMENLLICCTNMEKKAREEIYEKVQMMRGKTTKIFTEKVTHLITTEVGSAKYHAAAGIKIPVMLPDWVLDIWKTSENEEVTATDIQFLKHKCPIFYKYVICASGYSETVKNEIKNIVEAGGGTYRGDLVCGTTTHLITDETKGLKYEHAKMWKINIVKSQWIYKSMEAGYCLNEKDFVLDYQTSTPTDSRLVNKTRPKLENIDVSVISGPGSRPDAMGSMAGASTSNLTRVNETNKPNLNNSGFANSTFNSTTFIQSNKTLNAINSNTNNPNNKQNINFVDILKDLNQIGKIKITLFDGIGIYFENFDPSINEKLKKICNSGGATRFEEYNSDVTHCIVNQMNEMKCKSYIEMNPEVNIVNIDWLISSCKENKLVDCKPFYVYNNALNSVKTPKKRARPEKLTTPNQNTSKTFDTDLNDYLSQYYNAETKLMRPPPVPVFSAQQNSNPSNLFSNKQSLLQPQYERSKNDISINSEHINDQNNTTIQKTGVFAYKIFQIIGFDQFETESLAKVLVSEGAEIIPYDQESQDVRRKPVDYTLLPMTIPTPISNNNPVTVNWMRKSIEKKELLSLNQDILYQPIPRYNNDQPLSNCIITISGFGNMEKDQVGNICKLLGAHIQKQLSLKNSNEIKANTHLICEIANGPKYLAAKSWNLPAVGIDWLIESCVTGIKADEAKFTIENQGSNTDLIEALDRIRRNEENFTNSKMNTSSKINNNSTFLLAGMNSSKLVGRISRGGENEDDDYNNQNDSSLSFHQNESKKPRLETSINNKSKFDDKNEDVDSGSGNNIDDSNQLLLAAAAENSIKMQNIVKKTTTTTPNPSNPNNFNNIPTPCNPRLKELKKRESMHHQSPLLNNQNDSINSANNTPNPAGVSTPIWMKPAESRLNQEPKINFNFDYDQAMNFFKTPDAISANNRKSFINNNKYAVQNETPLDVQFAASIKIANENIQKPGFLNGCFTPTHEYSFEKKIKKNYQDLIKDFDDSVEMITGDDQNKQRKVSVKYDKNDEYDDDKIQPTPLETKHKKTILNNIRVYVSKKMVKYQSEFYKKVESLGGDFVWTFDAEFTHFIYQGRLNDNNNELQVAIEMNKIIVSPGWLNECEKQNKRVNEHLFALPNGFDRLSMASNSAVSDNREDEEVGEETNIQIENENQMVIDAKENHKVAQSEIPDSMDIKNMFLHQLQDKLASMKNNNTSNLSSGSKKWSKNLSGNNLSNGSPAINSETRTSDAISENENYITAEMNFKNNDNQQVITNEADETRLSEQQALEELNKSKSRWGINSDCDKNIDKRKKSRGIDDDKRGEDTKLNESNNSDDELFKNLAKENIDYMSIEKGKNHSNKYPRENSNHINVANDDQFGSPSLLNKDKSKKFNINNNNNSAPPSSQIQMTIWKDETSTTNQQPNTKSASSTSKNTRNSRNSNENSNVSTRNLRSDALADRLISATRAAPNSR